MSVVRPIMSLFGVFQANPFFRELLQLELTSRTSLIKLTGKILERTLAILSVLAEYSVRVRPDRGPCSGGTVYVLAAQCQPRFPLRKGGRRIIRQLTDP